MISAFALNDMIRFHSSKEESPCKNFGSEGPVEQSLDKIDVIIAMMSSY